jgi:hypothetical protein
MAICYCRYPRNEFCISEAIVKARINFFGPPQNLLVAVNFLGMIKQMHSARDFTEDPLVSVHCG